MRLARQIALALLVAYAGAPRAAAQTSPSAAPAVSPQRLRT